ncbi:TetR/AcrR family transcriptional regulator [Vagococcus entomophilus]|uniref:HTH tetR-type domain-containing protein n=1 Tax=Vagococcus entomophilus TaxID=1160095 RepID=A0A430AGZ1_9ENTE|nr:TetR/AcrR family transcriptional regulator [Vagococcus entomophilus]RSU07192.1 hypothetical protein CBF30_08035 [Vagococcus entomophilus]
MKKDLRIVKTRRNIQTTLLTILSEKSFRQVTVKDICQEALINKSTFYAHYSDKYALLEDVVAHYSHLLKAEVGPRFTQLSATHLLFIFKNLETTLSQNKKAYLILLDIHEAEGDLAKELETYFCTLCLDYLEKHELKLQVPHHFFALVYASYLMQLLLWTLKTGENMQILELSQALEQILYE